MGQCSFAGRQRPSTKPLPRHFAFSCVSEWTGNCTPSAEAQGADARRRHCSPETRQRNQRSLSAHDRLTERVAEQLIASGRIVWRELSLRAKVNVYGERAPSVGAQAKVLRRDALQTIRTDRVDGVAGSHSTLKGKRKRRHSISIALPGTCKGSSRHCASALCRGQNLRFRIGRAGMPRSTGSSFRTRSLSHDSSRSQPVGSSPDGNRHSAESASRLL